MGAQMLEVGMSLLVVGTVLRFERDAWSMMVKGLRQATNEYPPSSPPGGICFYFYFEFI